MVNETISFQKFLLQVWQNCLVHYQKNPQTHIPKSSNQKLAQHLKREAKLFNNRLDKFVDKSGRNGKIRASEMFLTGGLGKVLNKKSRDEMTEVLMIVRNLIDQTFNTYISDLN